MRLLFAGTPQVAVHSLEALLGSSHEVVAVLTRPDARAGRGRAMHPSPVKECALAHGIEVLTPPGTSDPAFVQRLGELGVDAAPVVAYGGLIPPALLSVPRHGWINLHFSLLPAWRGAAPVQHAIIAGDEVTGASVFALEAGLDTGPVFGTMTEVIRPGDTAGDLLDRLARGGAGLLLATLDALEQGRAHAVPQPSEGVSLAPKLTVADARLRWAEPAFAVDRRVRGCHPAPGAWSTLRGERVKIHAVQVTEEPPVTPGDLVVDRAEVLVGTGTTPVRLLTVQPAGKRAMAAADWARGARLASGERFEA